MFVGNIIGAFIAAIFGIASAIYLNWNEKRKHRKQVCRLIIAELDDIKNKDEFLFNTIKQKIIHEGVPVYSQFVYNNTFKNEKQILLQWLDDEKIKKIENIYRCYENFDIRLTDYKENRIVDNELALFQLRTFWGFYTTQREENINNIDEIIIVLKENC